MLQDHHTGQILDLNRRWKAFVKVAIPKSSAISTDDANLAQPGQTLDMSMIFRKRNSLSILCPWCNTENESSSDEQHIEWLVLLGTRFAQTGWLTSLQQS